MKTPAGRIDRLQCPCMRCAKFQLADGFSTVFQQFPNKWQYIYSQPTEHLIIRTAPNDHVYCLRFTFGYDSHCLANESCRLGHRVRKYIRVTRDLNNLRTYQVTMTLAAAGSQSPYLKIALRAAVTGFRFSWLNSSSCSLLYPIWKSSENPQIHQKQLNDNLADAAQGNPEMITMLEIPVQKTRD